MKKISSLAVLAMVAAPMLAQTFPTTTLLPAALADGVGACGNGPSTVLTVPVVGVTGATGLTLDFTFAPNHTWYGDVRCLVTSPSGASSLVMANGCDGSLDDPSDIGGPYVLMDGALTTFDTAAFAFTGVGPIPAGTYAPDGALNGLLAGCGVNGTWTVTFTDSFGGDTGSISACALTFGVGAPVNSFTICQAGPLAPLNLIHTNGPAGAITYTNAATFLTPAAVPLGWWFGLDIALGGPFGLLDQLTNPGYGPIFIGSVAAGGSSVLPIPGVPVGLTIQIVGVHFDGAGIPIFASTPVNYTVI